MTQLHQITIDLPQGTADEVVDNLSDYLAQDALTVSLDIGDNGLSLSGTFERAADADELQRRLNIVSAMLGTPVHFRADLLQTQDWLALVGRTAGAGKVGPFTLEDAPNENTRLITQRNIYVEALSAFGDGYHATTQGCLSALGKVRRTRPRVSSIADIGCGTGVLAIGAKKLWPRAVSIASDLDPVAVTVTTRNRGYNAARAIRVAGGPGMATRAVRRHGKSDLILANILARPLARLAKSVASRLQPGGHVILSGLLESQIRHLLFAYRAQRLALVGQSVQDGWVTLIMQKKAL